MNWLITFYVAILFFILSPGVFLTLPIKRDKYTIAAVHAFIFAMIWHFTHKFVSNSLLIASEGFQEGATDKIICDEGEHWNDRKRQCDANECEKGEMWYKKEKQCLVDKKEKDKK